MKIPMKNAITNLAEVEVKAKVTATLHAELTKGRRVSDMGARDFNRVTDQVVPTLSPEALKYAQREGLLHIVRMVLGERIAAKVWDAGAGWEAPEADIRQIARELRVADEDEAVECFALFREEVLDFRRSDVEEFSHKLDRFKPLFVAQPADATLGEIATRKAIHGDKLALSFLAWKEIA